ncbi:FAD-dependent oxidoreductase [Nesterenkonia populi]
MQRRVDVAVIGAGQAGLSAGYHLQRSGLDFVMLDAEHSPGGAWQHRWESLRMETINGIFDLPGLPKPPIDDAEPSRTAVPRYFADFERAMGLPIRRPVQVHSVSEADSGELTVRTDDSTWTARAVINATGTWSSPVLPELPGSDSFRGRQLHTRDYVSAEDLAGRRVAVVGGGISAVQLLAEISRTAATFWYTRREPVFQEEGFRPEVEGRQTIEKVTAAAEAGLPTRSIVSYTGLVWTPYARDAAARGALSRRPMFARIEPRGVREADGSLTTVDTILWATGFRPSLAHLEPLNLVNEQGGVAVRSTEVRADPRIHLIGFGPSQSTVGANRAGREAVRRLLKRLG